MHPYSYAISLRVSHPSIDPALITAALGLKPSTSWQFGEPRRTPKGTALEGTRRDSYWMSKLTEEHSSEGTRLEDYLVDFIEQLSPSRDFFSRIRTEGGRVEFSIALYGARNYGFELAPVVLASAASLGISLTFDVYHYPQNWR